MSTPSTAATTGAAHPPSPFPKPTATASLRPSTGTTPAPSPPRGLLAVPPAVKRLFDRFPLTTYPPNALPARAPRAEERGRARLYVFAEGTEERRGEREGGRVVSYNPGCLRYQAYLRFRGVEFTLVPSTNHASPTGSLPFLLPAETAGTTATPVPAAKLARWADARAGGFAEPADPRFDAYLALVDNEIRRGWLYALYLTSNFESIVAPRYIHAASATEGVRWALAASLRAAAAAELRKTAPAIDGELLRVEAREAFVALERLLGADEWFFGAETPGLLDAAVFAYTNWVWTGGFGWDWTDGWLVGVVEGLEGLRGHRERVRGRYFEL